MFKQAIPRDILQLNLISDHITLPETNMFAPENQTLEGEIPFLGWPICRSEQLVSGSL